MSAGEVTWKDVAKLGATNPRLFVRAYFPNTFRDEMPPFFDRIWAPLESPKVVFVNFQLFRGSSKTTNVRAFIGKRIAYALSRTILVICASQPKAELIVKWIRTQIERNHAYTASFGLRRGSPWNQDEIRIHHSVAGHDITVVGMGIHGSTRGLNIDDYRPDLIVVDDGLDDETASSPTQRDKLENLVLGALAKSLATETDNPNRKMIVTQTPFNHDDYSMKAFRDPTWYNVRQGCWSKDTENKPLDQQESIWEARFPTLDLRKDKMGHIARNKASLFSREMECKLVTPETSSFKREWIRFYDEDSCPPLNQMYVCMAIDPVPPPTAAEIEKGMHKKNYEVLACVGYHRGSYYVLEYRYNRGHEPNWTIATFFELMHKWQPKKLRVESHGYQSTLAWLLRNAMQSQGKYIPIEEERDKRSKFDKIVDPLAGPLSHGKLLVHPSMHDLITMITDYPNVGFDDIIEAVAKAVEGLTTADLFDGQLSGYEDETYGEIGYTGAAP
jgi:phage terminase large subunit-like protein